MWAARADALEVEPFRLRARYLTPATAPTGSTCRRFFVPDDPAIRAALYELVTRLTSPAVWEARPGGLSADETAVLCTFMWESESACMLGAIIPYTTTDPLPGTLPCDGSLFLRADYPELWAVLDAVWKLDADTFQTPDLRGRTIIGAGLGSGLTSRAFGETGGAEAVALSVDELPAHTHTSPAHSHTTTPHEHTTIPHEHAEGIAIPAIAAVLPPPDVVPSAVPGVGVTSPAGVTILPAGVTVNETAVSIDAAGGGDAHANMPPFLALKYCMVAR